MFPPVELTDNRGKLNPELEEVMRFRRPRPWVEDKTPPVVAPATLAANEGVAAVAR